MAWNQPGGGGGKDPWGSHGGQQGPPDLDEALKKLQARLNAILGGRGPGGGGIPAGGKGVKGFGVIALLILLVWAGLGIYIIDAPEKGVVLRFGKYARTAGPGLHWLPYLIERVEKVNVEQVRSEDIGFRQTASGQEVSVSSESLMLTQDENIIDIKFAIQYRVKEPKDYLFNVYEPDNTLRQATETAVREIVGKSDMDFVITEGRSDVANKVEQLIQQILDRYQAGLVVDNVNMQSAQPPKEVQESFFDAVKAREDEERTKNEARAYVADILPKARGEANAIRERAIAYKRGVVVRAQGETDRFLKVLKEYNKAPEVTRMRLYLDTVESMLTNSSKILIDAQGTNNLMYLPLEKLMAPREEMTGERPTVLLPSPDEMVPSSPRGEEDFRRQRPDTRERTR
jgi:membrane protease subunit HflK